MDKKQIDIKENYLYRLDWELLTIMLKDHSSGKNIIWATDNYAHRGAGFQRHDHIEISSITGYHGNVVKPRVEKSKKEQIDKRRKFLRPLGSAISRIIWWITHGSAKKMYLT